MTFEMKSTACRLSMVLVWSLAGFAVGCQTPESSPSRAVRDPGEPEVLATIDGSPVTVADLEDAIGDQLTQMEFKYKNQRYQIMSDALKNVVRDRVLEEEAASQGMSREELIDSVTEGKGLVTDADVAEWYRQNRARVGNRSLEEVSAQIKQYLLRAGPQQAVDGYAQELLEQRNIVYLLQPLRANLDTDDSPTYGPEDAPVTVVEFSDFECSYCRRVVGTLDQVKENYGDQVRIVFRQYPLQNHPSAQKAAEASLCANDQDKFWPMHDLLFAEQDRLDVDSLKKKADRIGLERAVFDDCLDSARHEEKVRSDMQDGTSVGVSGTPSLFVNGINVPGGAVSYETLSQVIDEELQRVGSE
jgi:protein-disulfide isomerase